MTESAPDLTSVFRELVSSQIRLLDDVDRLQAHCDYLRQRVDILTPRFNQFFRYEHEARAAWEIYKVLLNEPDRVFPGDAPPKRIRREEGIEIGDTQA